MKEILPKGNPSNINWGDVLEFPIENEVICVSKNNNILLKGYCQKKLRNPEDGADNPWVPTTGTADLTGMVFNENLASCMVPSVAMREGLNFLECQNYVHKGRYALENFINAHASPEVKKGMNFSYYDSNNKVFMEDTFKPGNENYDAWAKKILDDGFTFKVSPQCFPFTFAHPTSTTDVLFPNSGQEAVLQVTLEKSDQFCFFHQGTTTNNVTSPSKHLYRIVLESVKVNLVFPRMTAQGLEIIKNPRMPPLTFNGTYTLQYSQTIPGSQPDKHFSIQEIRMPHYMLLQLYDFNYFVPDNNIKELDRRYYTPKKFKLEDLKFKYGNRDLSYNVANMSWKDRLSSQLRQEILKHSDIFGIKTDGGYYHDLPNYNQPHLLISFCSNEETHELLKPVDAPFNRDEKQTLSIGLIGNNRDNLVAGRLLVTLFYERLGYTYMVDKGIFIPPDVRASVVSS